MIVILVCGGRDYGDRKRLFAVLDALVGELHGREPVAILHGGATGADTLAGEWATAREVVSIAVPAEWSKHGKAAGPLRNQRMVEQFRPDLAVVFPGGRGTADMERRCVNHDIKVAKVTTHLLAPAGAAHG